MKGTFFAFTMVIAIAFQFLAFPATVAVGQQSLNGRRIIVDPGHGWTNDPYEEWLGAQSYPVFEKDVVMLIARKVRDRLTAQGAIVYLTRDGDDASDIGSKSASRRANAFGGDLAVSIHAGGATGASATGACKQVNHPRVADSETLAIKLVSRVSAQLAIPKETQDSNHDGVGDALDPNYCSRSGRYQLYIDDFVMPTAIIETGHIDGDQVKLLTRQDDFAKAIVDGIVDYLSTYTPQPEQPSLHYVNAVIKQAINGRVVVMNVCSNNLANQQVYAQARIYRNSFFPELAIFPATTAIVSDGDGRQCAVFNVFDASSYQGPVIIQFKAAINQNPDSIGWDDAFNRSNYDDYCYYQGSGKRIVCLKYSAEFGPYSPPASPTVTTAPASTPAPSPSIQGITLVSAYPQGNRVNPNDAIRPEVVVRTTGLTLDCSPDHLKPLDSNTFGAYVVQQCVPLGGNQYRFTFNSQMQAPSSPGEYHSRWQIWKSPNLIGPAIDLWFQVGNPPPPSGSWSANYFSDNHLGTRCNDTQYITDVYLMLDSRTGWRTPANCPNADQSWSVIIDREVDFGSGGDVEFCMQADDKARLKVDGLTVVDRWDSLQNCESKGLTGGRHSVRIEFANNAGDAVLQAWWRGPGGLPRLSSTYDSNQWTQEIWGNMFQWHDIVGKVDAGSGILNFDWSGRGPGWGVPIEYWSTRFSRTIYLSCGKYRFHLVSDDGARVTINGQVPPSLDRWQTGVWDQTADLDLQDGPQQFIVDYFQNGGGANLRFDWLLLESCASTPSPTATPMPMPTPTTAALPSGVELLSSGPWHLTGNNGASEKYQSISPNALQGKTMLRITYDLHGLAALCGDASAIIFDQNDWQYVSLCNYGMNGFNGLQTVDVPLSAFVGLDPNANVGTLHTRFWNGGPFTVDITSIVAYNAQTSPTSSSTPTVMPATSTPSTSTDVCSGALELLTQPWLLTGNNGASEKYQSISPNILQGKTKLQIRYNLRGLLSLGGDASAIIFDQNGWKFISLSNYGQNGLNWEQTVVVPLSQFSGLNTNATVGTLHTRFWYGSPFTVDIFSIKACD